MGINSWFINQQTLVGSLDHEFYDFPYIYIYMGMSSSQLTNSYFSEG